MSINRQRAADKLAALQSKLRGRPVRQRARNKFDVGNNWPAHLLGDDLPADDMPTWLFKVSHK